MVPLIKFVLARMFFAGMGVFCALSIFLLQGAWMLKIRIFNSILDWPVNVILGTMSMITAAGLAAFFFGLAGAPFATKKELKKFFKGSRQSRTLDKNRTKGQG